MHLRGRELLRLANDITTDVRDSKYGLRIGDMRRNDVEIRIVFIALDWNIECKVMQRAIEPQT